MRSIADVVMRQRLALFALTALTACHQDRPTEPPQPALCAATPSVAPAAPDTLFTLVADPVLTGEQQRLLSIVRSQPWSAEVHVALLAADPAALLQRGKAVVFTVSPKSSYAAVGEQITPQSADYISWRGPLQNIFGWVELVLSSKGVTGSLRTETTLYRFQPISGGLQAISCVDQTKFPPD